MTYFYILRQAQGERSFKFLRIHTLILVTHLPHTSLFAAHAEKQIYAAANEDVCGT